MKTRWYRVEGPNFVAAVEIDNSDTIITTAPILYVFIGQLFANLCAWCESKQFSVTPLKGGDCNAPQTGEAPTQASN